MTDPVKKLLEEASAAVAGESDAVFVERFIQNGWKLMAVVKHDGAPLDQPSQAAIMLPVPVIYKLLTLLDEKPELFADRKK